MGFLPVFLGHFILVSWLHGSVSLFLPFGRAHFSEFIGILESLDKTDHLISVSSDWEIVVGHVSKFAFSVDDEGGSKGDTSVVSSLDESVVGLGDFSGDVGEEGHFDFADSSEFFGGLAPSGVDEVTGN